MCKWTVSASLTELVLDDFDDLHEQHAQSLAMLVFCLGRACPAIPCWDEWPSSSHMYGVLSAKLYYPRLINR